MKFKNKIFLSSCSRFSYRVKNDGILQTAVKLKKRLFSRPIMVVPNSDQLQAHPGCSGFGYKNGNTHPCGLYDYFLKSGGPSYIEAYPRLKPAPAIFCLKSRRAHCACPHLPQKTGRRNVNTRRTRALNPLFGKWYFGRKAFAGRVDRGLPKLSGRKFFCVRD